jgi:hypothetical protein
MRADRGTASVGDEDTAVGIVHLRIAAVRAHDTVSPVRYGVLIGVVAVRGRDDGRERAGRAGLDSLAVEVLLVVRYQSSTTLATARSTSP